MQYLTLSLVMLMPFLAAAQGTEAEPNLNFFQSLLLQLGELIKIAVPILVALAVLLFIWGVIKFVFAAENDEARAEGKKVMTWGIIALFVIVSVWGLVELLQQLSGIGGGAGPDPIPLPGL